MSKAIEMTGMRFGRLTVIKRAEKPENCYDNYAWWQCACDCGKQTNVRGSSLRSGLTKSCGCIRSEHGREMFAMFHEWRRNDAAD